MKHRRTVRIVKPRTASYATIISLVLATVAAAATMLVWRSWQHVDEDPQVIRTEVELNWQCEVGHTFRASGQITPRTCWTCDRPAYPVTTYACPQHGSHEVLVRFSPGEDDVPQKSHLKIVGRKWVPAEQGLKCPRCGRALIYKGRDPLEHFRRRVENDGD